MAGKDGNKPVKRVRTEWDRNTQNMGFLEYWYFQYLISSALYMLEPWERNLFHTILFLVFGMMIYSAYIYLPYHSAVIYQTLMDFWHNMSDKSAS